MRQETSSIPSYTWKRENFQMDHNTVQEPSYKAVPRQKVPLDDMISHQFAILKKHI